MALCTATVCRESGERERERARKRERESEGWIRYPGPLISIDETIYLCPRALSIRPGHLSIGTTRTRVSKANVSASRPSYHGIATSFTNCFDHASIKVDYFLFFLSSVFLFPPLPLFSPTSPHDFSKHERIRGWITSNPRISL